MDEFVRTRNCRAKRAEFALGALLLLVLSACASNESIAPVEPSVTPAPSATATVSPTPTLAPKPPNPLSIAVMRQRNYPGSDIVIEQTLAPGANYNRFVASYRSDGLKIYGLLTVPRGAKPASGFPVIIFNHGYIPPSEYRTTERYVAYVDAIARSGYIVFKSDYRGHGDSEGVANGAYAAPDYTVDILNLSSSLKKFKDADPKRIGMWGHSMGGQIALRSLVITPDIKAAAIWAGVTTPYTGDFNWRPTSPGGNGVPSAGARLWRAGMIQEYGSPEENPDFWNSISPNSYLQDITAPIQLHHGTNDQSVAYRVSEEFARELKQANRVYEFYSYPGDDHNLSRSLAVAMQRSIAFFDKYVKGK